MRQDLSLHLTGDCLKTWWEPVTRFTTQPSRSRRRLMSRLLVSMCSGVHRPLYHGVMRGMRRSFPANYRNREDGVVNFLGVDCTMVTLRTVIFAHLHHAPHCFINRTTFQSSDRRLGKLPRRKRQQQESVEIGSRCIPQRLSLNHEQGLLHSSLRRRVRAWPELFCLARLPVSGEAFLTQQRSLLY